MPIYEYECDRCGDVFEHLSVTQRRNASVECPVCGASTTSRKLSVFGVGGARQSTSMPIMQGPSCPNCVGGPSCPNQT